MICVCVDTLTRMCLCAGIHMSVFMCSYVYVCTERRSGLGFKQKLFLTKYITYKLIPREMKSQAQHFF